MKKKITFENKWQLKLSKKWLFYDLNIRTFDPFSCSSCLYLKTLLKNSSVKSYENFRTDYTEVVAAPAEDPPYDDDNQESVALPAEYDDESVAIAKVPFFGNGALGLTKANLFKSSPVADLKNPFKSVPDHSHNLGLPSLKSHHKPHGSLLGHSSPLLGNTHSKPSLFNQPDHSSFSLPATQKFELPNVNLPNLFDKNSDHHSPPSIFNRNHYTPSISTVKKPTQCTCYCDL